MLRTLLFIGCLFYTYSVFTQDEGDIWVMGYNRTQVIEEDFGISYWNFSSGSPVIEYDLELLLWLWRTNASVSKNGEVLLVTNGMEVLAPSGERILDTIAFGDEWLSNVDGNGMTLGFAYPQGAFIIPVPGRVNEYSVIYGRTEVPPGNVFPELYRVLEARLRINSNNSWDVLFKDKLIYQHQYLDHGWHACRHANGRDWWILMHEHEGSHYYRLLFGPEGLEYIGAQEFQGEDHSSFLFSSWFSPDGTKYARYSNVQPDTQLLLNLDIYDFDRCTGLLGDRARIVLHTDELAIEGMAFAGDSRSLFITNNAAEVYQYDLFANDIESSRMLVDTFDGFVEPNWFPTWFGRMMPGPDGRVYMFPTAGSSRFMHVIDRPNERGKDSKLLQHEIFTPTSKTQTVQSAPNYRLGPLDGSPCDTLSINNHPVSWWRHEVEAEDPREIRFTDLSYFRPEIWEWDFGDGESGSEPNPIHTYPGPGLYHACLTVSNEYNSDSSCQWIDVMTVSTEETAIEEFKVFPNPFTDFIEIHPDNGFRSFTVGIMDANGRLIYTPEVTCPCRLKLDVPAGVYFYRIIEDGVLLKSGKIVRI